MIFRRYRRIIKELRETNHIQYESLELKKIEIRNLRREINQLVRNRDYELETLHSAINELDKEVLENRTYKDKYIKLLAALEVKGVEITFNED